MTVELVWMVAVREWKGKPLDATSRTWWVGGSEAE